MDLQSLRVFIQVAELNSFTRAGEKMGYSQPTVSFQIKQLEQELENLRTVKRTEVKERLKEAIALGDLSENSEYDDAKNEQAFMEGRILELEKMIRNAKIIEDGEQQNDTITVGSLVTVKDIEFDEITEYRLVGTVEADPMNNRISNESPVGRALLGHKAGEIIEVEAPVGVIKLEIVEVSRG